MAQHAACSPSSAAMWLACPASVTLTKDMERPSSKYAREGTAAHQVAEMILNGDVFLPDRITVEGQEFIVSAGMCRDLNPYVGRVQALMASPGARGWIEQRIVVPDTFNRVWGTLDCGIVVEQDTQLHVVDLKFGRGVPVEPDSPQLKLYGLGLAALAKASNLAKIDLTVCQPRVAGGPFRTCTATVGDLYFWLHTEVRPAIRRIIDGDTTEKAGPYCRWCVRRQECVAFNSRHQGHAAEAFADQPGGPP